MTWGTLNINMQILLASTFKSLFKITKKSRIEQVETQIVLSGRKKKPKERYHKYFPTFKSNTMPIKTPTGLFLKPDMKILKLKWKNNYTEKAKKTKKKEEQRWKREDLALPYIKT